MPNILDANLRSKVLADISGQENRQRKNESIKRYDIYNKRQDAYVRERLTREYSADTVRDMRVVSSINLAKRIVNAKSSLYTTSPDRSFANKSGSELSDQEKAQINALYDLDSTNVKMKKANRYYKLQQQIAIQIMPRDGIVETRILQPHHFDVIPEDSNPEVAAAYVISAYDRSLLYNNIQPQRSGETNYLSGSYTDQINQIIADPNDDKFSEKNQARYIWWSKDFNFVTNGHGSIIDAVGTPLVLRSQDDLRFIENPLGELPFIDVCEDKDFEYWVRQGNDTIDFSLDFSVGLSDTSEVNKRQGYAQAVVKSEEPPKDIRVGPNRVLHLKLDPNKEVQPEFSWMSPSADLGSSIKLIDTMLSLFLTAEDVDPKTISTKGDSQTFASGLDRLLYMLDRFESSKDDMDLFKGVEQKVFDLKRKWSNLLIGANVDGGITPLVPKLQEATISEDILMTIKYAEPMAIQSDKEIQDAQISLLDSQLTTKVKAIMKIHGLSEAAAIEFLQAIDQEGAPLV